MKKKKNQFSDYDKFEEDEEELTLSEEVDQIDREKRNRTIKKLITKIFLVVLTLCLCLAMFSLVSFCWVDKDAQTSVTQNLTNIDGTFYTNGKLNEDLVVKMQTFIANMPKSYKDALADDWAIVLLEKTPERLFHSSFISINDYDTSGMIIGGYTFTQSRTIYINRTLDNDDIYRSFVHEMGHFVSFELSSAHGSSEWEAIYNQALEVGFETDGYNLSNEAEFFATCFDMYYNEPDTLKSQSQDAYNYMSTLMNNEVQDDNIFEVFLAGCKNSINTLRVYYYYYIVKR